MGIMAVNDQHKAITMVEMNPVTLQNAKHVRILSYKDYHVA